jgi:putative peptidoglycan lipid II flippase
MGLCLWLATLALGPVFGMAGLKYLALAALVAVGMGSYFVIGSAIGAFALSDIRGAVRR